MKLPLSGDMLGWGQISDNACFLLLFWFYAERYSETAIRRADTFVRGQRWWQTAEC